MTRFMSYVIRAPYMEIIPDLLNDAFAIVMHELMSEQKRGTSNTAARKAGAKGESLHPGARTPLWNALVEALRPLLAKRGAQARLARHLGLQRQAVNAFVTQRTRMPDAERTLQILAWMAVVKRTQSAPSNPSEAENSRRPTAPGKSQ